MTAIRVSGRVSCESLDDDEGRGSRPGAFQHRGEHVEALFGECLGRKASFGGQICGRKIRPQIRGLQLCQFKHVVRRELGGVVTHRLRLIRNS